MGKGAKEIYEIGEDSGPYTCKVSLNDLLKADQTGEYIYWAGRNWCWFDYDRALDRLLEVDKTGKWICYAGIFWEQFDYERALERLIEIDNTGEFIYGAYKLWQTCNYQKAFNVLLTADKTGEYIYDAGLQRKWFDYERALDRIVDIIKNNNGNPIHIVRIARYWPLSSNNLLRKYIKYANELLANNRKLLIKSLLNLLETQELNEHERVDIIQRLIEIGGFSTVRDTIRKILQNGLIIRNLSRNLVLHFIDDII